jgi:hypothetical protein
VPPVGVASTSDWRDAPHSGDVDAGVAVGFVVWTAVAVGAGVGVEDAGGTEEAVGAAVALGLGEAVAVARGCAVGLGADVAATAAPKTKIAEATLSAVFFAPFPLVD